VAEQIVMYMGLNTYPIIQFKMQFVKMKRDCLSSLVAPGEITRILGGVTNSKEFSFIKPAHPEHLGKITSTLIWRTTCTKIRDRKDGQMWKIVSLKSNKRQKIFKGGDPESSSG